MESKKLRDDRISPVSSAGSKDFSKYKCPYCKYQFTPRSQRVNCPNCAREIILWDILNHV